MKDILYINFPQNKLLNLWKEGTKLDFTDLALLEYIEWARGSSKMLKYYEEESNKNFVWINHNKLLDDVPFFDIKESALKKRLNRLCQVGLLEYKLFSNKGGRGTRAYYTLSEKCEDLKISEDKTTSTTSEKKMTEVIKNGATSDTEMTEKDGAGVKFSPSYKEITIDKEITIVKETKAKKSMVETVLDEFPIFVNNPNLVKAYLDFAEMRKAKGKKSEMKTEGTVRTSVNKLLKLGGDNVRLVEAIINQSIERCWDGFFEVKESNDYFGDELKRISAEKSLSKNEGQIEISFTTPLALPTNNQPSGMTEEEQEAFLRECGI